MSYRMLKRLIETVILLYLTSSLTLPLRAKEPSQLFFVNNDLRVNLFLHQKQQKNSSNVRYYYMVGNNNKKHHFGLLNRLLITGSTELKKLDWHKYPFVKEAKTLVELEDLVVISADLRNWQLQKAIDDLSRLPSVINVQPELLSLKFYRPETTKVSGTTNIAGEQPDVVANKTQLVDEQSQSGKLIEQVSNYSYVSDIENKTNSSTPYQREQKRWKVALIDDGFNFHHPALTNVNVIFQFDIDSGKLDASAISAKDRHGTMGLGLLQGKEWQGVQSGLAADAEIIAIRLVKAQTSHLILAASIARMMAADIINMSLTLNYLPEPLARVIAYDRADSPMPLTIVAAGNTATDACVGNQLAEIESLIVVGAANSHRVTTSEKYRLSYSNYGKCVDLYAPQGMLTTSVDGKTTVYEGTSASAVWLTGKLSHLAMESGLPVIEVKALLHEKTLDELFD